MGRDENVSIFEDTKNICKSHPAVRNAIKLSNDHQEIFLEGDPVFPEPRLLSDPAKVIVSKRRSYEAAMRYMGHETCVLNFASATRPGGGVKSGSSAQEESLCRCSTLFPTIDRKWLWQKYYDVNRAAQNVLHTDACIYSPGVILCKTDESIPKRMKPSDFVTVDVISCAAPNLRNEPANYHYPETGKPVRMDPDQLRSIHMKRARHIMHVAAANKVDILILGAFGCGAFANDPEIVAQAYRMAIIEYLPRFDVIEFAIYCKDHETDNYKAFYERFELLIDNQG